MKKIQRLGLVVAMVVLSAITTTTASGEVTLLAEWLFSGASITELSSVEASGLLLLTDLKGALGSPVGTHCEGLFKGSVGPDGEDEITEVLSALGVVIGSNLTGTALECAPETGDSGCASSPIPLVWVNNLPWGTLLFSIEGVEFLDAIGVGAKEPEYELECTVLGVKAVDTCKGLYSVLMENMASESDVLETFNTESGKGYCSLSGAGEGDIEGEGLVSTLSGAPIAVSNETTFAEPTLLAEWLFSGASITELSSVEASGLLLLTDLKGALGSPVGTHCEGLFKGSVGPDGEDEITEVLSALGVVIGSNLTGTALECAPETGDSGCASSPIPLVWVNNLPWGTLLFSIEGVEFLDAIGVGAKEPEYELECTVLGVKAVDTCKGLYSVLMENMASESDVLETFNTESGKGYCSLSGAGEGDIEGEGLVSTLSGAPIAVSNETTFAEPTLLAEWLFSGASITELSSVEASGLLLLTDLKGALGSPVGTHCEGLFKGSVGPDGEDEITEVLSALGVVIGSNLTGTALECAPETGDSGCASSPIPLVWVNNLPWGTLLFSIEGVEFLDAIGVGAKEPEYELECTVLGVKAVDTCKGLYSVLMENMASESDVLETFNTESGKGYCSLSGAGEGDIEGEGLVSTLSGAPIAVSNE